MFYLSYQEFHKNRILFSLNHCQSRFLRFPCQHRVAMDAFISNKLNYCKALLSGFPKKSMLNLTYSKCFSEAQKAGRRNTRFRKTMIDLKILPGLCKSHNGPKPYLFELLLNKSRLRFSDTSLLVTLE